jgi:hypothetical protein
MLSSLIDAFEGRKVVTVDIKGAFLKAKEPKEMELIIRMDGELAELLCELHPEFKRDEPGILYLKQIKAFYGHIEAARLFYDDLDGTLTQKLGLKRNAYEPSVHNKRTTDGAVTIRTHAYDLSASSRSTKQLEIMFIELKAIFGEITVHEEEEHDYLGMIMKYDWNKKSVQINMGECISGCVEEFKEDVPETVFKTVITPASVHLFQVRETGVEKLSTLRAKVFHSTVAKLLFVTKSGRQDILLAISFLTAKVKQPDEDDWKKLCRVLNYLSSTLDFVLTLGYDNLDQLSRNIDGSYAVHGDMKGKIGAIMMTDGCALLAKLKVNTRSSTKAELIAVDDALPAVQWTKNFMKDQGYDLDAVLQEDNWSTLLLLKNGKLSARKSTKHLDTRYFYVKDLIDKGINRVDHCVSDKMIADFFTKPPQGQSFNCSETLFLIKEIQIQYKSVLGTGDKENIVPEKSVPDTRK